MRQRAKAEVSYSFGVGAVESSTYCAHLISQCIPRHSGVLLCLSRPVTMGCGTDGHRLILCNIAIRHAASLSRTPLCRRSLLIFFSGPRTRCSDKVRESV